MLIVIYVGWRSPVPEMKSILSSAILFACVAGAFLLGRGMVSDLTADAMPSEGLRGTYRIEQDATPVHGLRFLDAGRVENLADGVVSGPMCTYVVEGKKLVLTHSCGTSVYTLHKGVLRDRKTGWTYRPVSASR